MTLKKNATEEDILIFLNKKRLDNKRYCTINREKINEKQREKYRKAADTDREKGKIRDRNKNLRRRGLTPETWVEKLQAQGFSCACCKNKFISLPQIDHNHITGETRCLICPKCNLGLGHSETCKEIFEEYLKLYPQ